MMGEVIILPENKKNRVESRNGPSCYSEWENHGNRYARILGFEGRRTPA